MHQNEVLALWFQLQEKYDLQDWHLKFNTNKRFRGWCKPRYKRIELSIYMLNSDTPKGITNTLLHEIAHAIVGCHHQHNEVWRQKAIEIGCDGNRCGDAFEVEPNYIAFCPNCNKKYSCFRLPRNNGTRVCSTCYHSKVPPARCMLTWCPNPRTVNPFEENERRVLTMKASDDKLSSVVESEDGNDLHTTTELNRTSDAIKRRRILKGRNKMTEVMTKAIANGDVVLENVTKTQKTRGKGSRELTYSYDNVDFKTFEGVIAYFTGAKKTVEVPNGNNEDGTPKMVKRTVEVAPEQAVLEALSEYASDMNQQESWETLFELSDTDKQIRAAAKKLVGLLPGIDSIEKAEEFVRQQIETAAKG